MNKINLKKKRCKWCLSHPIYIKYHDEEWGKIKKDDNQLFELLSLEGAQAGLSWITILKKRDEYRKAFDDFNIFKVSEYNEKNIELLLKNKGIIRNRSKIKSIINNAKLIIKIQKEHGSFSNFFWSYTNGKQIVNHPKGIEDVPAKTALSEKISKDFKKIGFKYVGPVIIYSFMQSCGMVNDHIDSCDFK